MAYDQRPLFSPDHGCKYIGDSGPWKEVFLLIESCTHHAAHGLDIHMWCPQVIEGCTSGLHEVAIASLDWGVHTLEHYQTQLMTPRTEGVFLDTWGLSLCTNKFWVPWWFISIPEDLQLLHFGYLSKLWTRGTFFLLITSILYLSLHHR